MNPIRVLRSRASVTQAELATAGGTSQPTIAAYESDRKSPSLATVRRLAARVGLEAWIDYHPPMTREERRSLALHRAIVAHLEGDPDRVIALARANLRRMKRRARSHLLDEWDVLLNRPVAALLPVLTDPSMWARELRHVTPFAGVLSAGERTAVYAAFVGDERVAS
jgi:transcriptional regulator with XRE-family HTH domain